MFHFTSFNTYEDDEQNELFVGANIIGEMNTQPSILYTVYEKKFLRIYYFNKLKHGKFQLL